MEKFLSALNNATDYTATVSKHFDYADLIAIKYFMHTCDTGKLLKLAHMRNWPHDKKWYDLCPTCIAKDQISLKTTIQ